MGRCLGQAMSDPACYSVRMWLVTERGMYQIERLRKDVFRIGAPAREDLQKLLILVKRDVSIRRKAMGGTGFSIDVGTRDFCYIMGILASEMDQVTVSRQPGGFPNQEAQMEAFHRVRKILAALDRVDG